MSEYHLKIIAEAPTGPTAEERYVEALARIRRGNWEHLPEAGRDRAKRLARETLRFPHKQVALALLRDLERDRDGWRNTAIALLRRLEALGEITPYSATDPGTEPQEGSQPL